MLVHSDLKLWLEHYSDMLFSENLDFDSTQYKEFLQVFEDRRNERICWCDTQNNQDLLNITPHVLNDNVSTKTCFSLVTGLSSMLLRAGIDPQQYFPYIPYRFLFGNSFLTEYEVAEGKHYIDALGFSGCVSLKKVVLPSDITSINDYGFGFCIKLKHIIFKGTIEQWKNITFGKCCWTHVPCSNVICSDGTTRLRVKK